MEYLQYEEEKQSDVPVTLIVLNLVINGIPSIPNMKNVGSCIHFNRF